MVGALHGNEHSKCEGVGSSIGANPASGVLCLIAQIQKWTCRKVTAKWQHRMDTTVFICSENIAYINLVINRRDLTF